MIDMFKTHPRFVVGAIIVHVLFISLFVLSFTFSEDKKAITPPKSVDVVAVSNKQVEKELKQLEKADKAEKNKRERERKKAERERKKEEKELKKLRDDRKKEEKKAQLEKEDVKRKAKEKAAKEKQQLEEKKQAEEKEKQEKLQKEKELVEKEKRDTEAKERFEKENAQQIADADQQIKTDNKNKEISLKEKYKYLIIVKINKNWVYPSNIQKKDLSCDILIRLSPGGDVIDFKILRSSGNVAFDKSVEAAVKKARTLPLPPRDANLFEEFRELELTIYPFDDKV